MPDLIISERQQIARRRISAMESGIQKAINKVCEEEKFEVTYAEINTALLNVLKSNLGHELKSLWEKPEE